MTGGGAARSVLVTGAGSGIGRATVEAFAAHGHRVVAAVRDPATAPAFPGGVTVVGIDVRDDAAVADGVATALEWAGGRLDVVVNNAGIAASGSVETIDWVTARDVFETNLWGAMRLARAVLPSMRAAGSGLIVNVSSVGGRTPARGFQGVYAGSKHALRSLSEALHWEVAPFGVRVVLLEPGFVATNIFERARFGRPADLDDPYAAEEAWVRRFFVDGAAVHAVAPAVVAEAVVAIADEASPALYQPIGAEAVAGIDAARAAPDFETWQAGALRRVADVAGPRPGT
jgi:NAD(P)-dependent dehydrogenase (short-subunit alcohol dehydrogenase family)